jgi:hypothetical protein
MFGRPAPLMRKDVSLLLRNLARTACSRVQIIGPIVRFNTILRAGS